VSLGAFGLLLFIMPLLMVCRVLIAAQSRHDKADPTERDIRVAVATMIGVLAQGIVVSNVPSLGNVMNVLCMTLVMAVWGHVCLLPGLQRVAVASRAPARPRLPSAARRILTAEPSA